MISCALSSPRRLPAAPAGRSFELIAFRLRFDSDLPPLIRDGVHRHMPVARRVRGLISRRSGTRGSGVLQHHDPGRWLARRRQLGHSQASRARHSDRALSPIHLRHRRAEALLTLLAGIRLAATGSPVSDCRPSKRVLIVGAGDAGERAARQSRAMDRDASRSGSWTTTGARWACASTACRSGAPWSTCRGFSSGSGRPGS